MPITRIPFDAEYMNHKTGTRVLGEHPGSRVHVCGVMSERAHDHPDWGKGNRWACTRVKGHLGRHEAGMGDGTMVASWAPRPSD